jgi:hypothetical protein
VCVISVYGDMRKGDEFKCVTDGPVSELILSTKEQVVMMVRSRVTLVRMNQVSVWTQFVLYVSGMV